MTSVDKDSKIFRVTAERDYITVIYPTVYGSCIDGIVRIILCRMPSDSTRQPHSSLIETMTDYTVTSLASE